jgi:hypothetical protein
MCERCGYDVVGGKLLCAWCIRELRRIRREREDERLGISGVPRGMEGR